MGKKATEAVRKFTKLRNVSGRFYCMSKEFIIKLFVNSITVVPEH